MIYILNIMTMSKLLFMYIVLQNDFLSNIGKIYSVVALILVIFLGIAFFLWRIDNKISKLEKQIKHEHEAS